MTAKVNIPRQRLAQFCQKHRIRQLSLFGSVLSDDFSPESDIDVLVEFEPDATPGYFQLQTIEEELSALFDAQRVDLRTPHELSRYFRDEVLSSAETIYELEGQSTVVSHP